MTCVRILRVNDKNILVLASNSPRRKQLLGLGNWNFVVNVADIDEAVLEGETPKEYVIRLAQGKALAVKDKATVDNIIIGSDTTVVVDDTIHFMTHYQKFKQAGMATVDAVREVFVSSGLAMITTTVALIGGFGILAFSHYSANANMGFLTAVCMFLAIIFDLCALPAWLVWRDKVGVNHD